RAPAASAVDLAPRWRTVVMPRLAPPLPRKESTMKIRSFGCTLAALVLLTPATQAAAPTEGHAGPPKRWNILWISCEDISPDLGCYGDTYARSPNLDKFAKQGMRFTRAFTVAGVCAPSRSGIITGMYPTTIGTHHMRSKGVPPEYVHCFTEYL